MKHSLLKFLACPNCNASQFTVEAHKTTTSQICSSHINPNHINDGIDLDGAVEQEIVEGALHCGTCDTIYLITDGIPRMLLDNTESSRSAHQLTSIGEDTSVWERHFLELSEPRTRNDYLGKTVLDAGCGYGRHAYYAARFGAEVIAIDSSADAVEATKRNCASYRNVHVIQADAAHMPLKDQSVDIVYAYGLLHHVEDPNAILSAMDLALKSGGSLSVWVYGPRQGLTLMINNALRGATTNMTHDQLLSLSKGIARGLRVFSHTPYMLLQTVPVARQVVSHLPVHDHYQWPFDVVVADVYDRLRVPVLHWFTGETIERWYGDHGYANFDVRRVVRNNETFIGHGTKR